MTVLYILSAVADVFGVLAAIFSALAWRQSWKLRQESKREQERMARRINIVLRLHDGSREVPLHVQIARAEMSRAELLGYLGMIPMRVPGQRFSLSYLNTSRFLAELRRIQSSDTDDTLVILCSSREIDQFQEDQLAARDQESPVAATAS
jgi:hypothetical protein